MIHVQQTQLQKVFLSKGRSWRTQKKGGVQDVTGFKTLSDQLKCRCPAADVLCTFESSCLLCRRQTGILGVHFITLVMQLCQALLQKPVTSKIDASFLWQDEDFACPAVPPRLPANTCCCLCGPTCPCQTLIPFFF